MRSEARRKQKPNAVHNVVQPHSSSRERIRGPRAREVAPVLMMMPQLVVSGISTGMLYAVVALSMTVVYQAPPPW